MLQNYFTIALRNNSASQFITVLCRSVSASLFLYPIILLTGCQSTSPVSVHQHLLPQPFVALVPNVLRRVVAIEFKCTKFFPLKTVRFVSLNVLCVLLGMTYGFMRFVRFYLRFTQRPNFLGIGMVLAISCISSLQTTRGPCKNAGRGLLLRLRLSQGALLL